MKTRILSFEIPRVGISFRRRTPFIGIRFIIFLRMRLHTFLRENPHARRATFYARVRQRRRVLFRDRRSDIRPGQREVCPGRDPPGPLCNFIRASLFGAPVAVAGGLSSRSRCSAKCC